MDYLDSVPRRVVTVYLPLLVFLIVLLFPFYWMAITRSSRTPSCCRAKATRSGSSDPTLEHINKLLFDTGYPDWLWNTVLVSVVATFVSLASQRCSPPTRSSGCASRARARRAGIFLAYLVPPSILFIPLAAMVFKLRPVRHPTGR